MSTINWQDEYAKLADEYAVLAGIADKDRALLKELLKDFKNCACDYDEGVAVRESIKIIERRLEEKDGSKEIKDKGEQKRGSV